MTFNESQLLIIGGTGRLGKAFKKIIPNALYPTRSELDVTDKNKIKKYFETYRPKYVINLVAITDIPFCEKNKKETWSVNVDGTKNIIQMASSIASTELVIYLNTACIFSGDEDDVFYDEDSLPNPKHFYGLTKLIGEEIVKCYNSEKMQVIVARTNFTSMPWEYPKAFTDRFGTYLFAQGVVKGLLDLVTERPKLPVVHICGDKKLSMYEYAKAGGSDVEPMTFDDYDGAPLTKNMCLTSKYWKLYRLEDSDWNDE